MPLAAGDLDRRITIERAQSVRNEFNEPEEQWHALATVWASKRDVSDRERVASQEVGAEVTTRFQIRWSTQVRDVDAKDRITFDGRTYSIVATKELGRREGIEITAAARAD